MRRQTTTRRGPRRFICQGCGCDVYQPENDERPDIDGMEDFKCLNCWFGRIKEGEQ